MEPRQSIQLCLSTHEQQSDLWQRRDSPQQFEPLFFRPIFLWASASGVDGHEKGVGFPGFFWGDRELRNRIRSVDCQSLERPQENLARWNTGALIRPMRPGDELRLRTPGYVRL